MVAGEEAEVEAGLVGEVIGLCAGGVELGWLIRRRHWGHGYASEAALELRPVGPERTVHLIHPDNAASIAVARKLGAVHERDTELRGGPVSIYVSLV